MTDALEPELAAAYVRELSTDVRDVVVLDPEGNHLAGPGPIAAAAAALPRETATYVTDAGTVWVAAGPDRTVVAVAGPSAIPGPTALDVAVAAGAEAPAESAASPGEPLKKAISDVFQAT